MPSLRSRYYSWLLKAYFKRMKRTILSSIVLGILVCLALIGLINYYFKPLLYKTTVNVGYAGSYTLQTLPNEILDEISYGLTKIAKNGQILPGAATSYTVSDNKIYTFKLKKGIYFHNGKELTSSNLGYDFSGVTFKALDKYTAQYILKSPYSPFLTTVSRPILGKNLEGIGRYKIENIDLNAGFVRSIILVDTQNKNHVKKIYFYPTQRALKVAFMLGEVSQIYGVNNTQIDSTNLSAWKKVTTQSYINYGTLVAIFYNNNDDILNNKKIRQALNYALPEKVPYGQRSYGPIPPISMYFEQSPTYKISDVELSKTLLSTVKNPIPKPLIITTTEEFVPIALQVQEEWKKIGVKSKIQIVSTFPTDFQIFLYRIILPTDPDQYILWHSDQINNIVHYKNLRIDKILEDGRSTTDITQRKKLYADFQKYLTDDVPASFYYFPREYNLFKN